MSKLIVPYGGSLACRMLPPEAAAAARAASVDYPSLTLTETQLCHLELLLTGAYSPLRGYLGRADHAAVLAEQRLADGTLWPLPLTLRVPRAALEGVTAGEPLALRDVEGLLVAVLRAPEVWDAEPEAEAVALFGTTDPAHPGVHKLLEVGDAVHVGGEVEGVELPPHHDFRALRMTPSEARAWLAERGQQAIALHAPNVPQHAMLAAAREAVARVEGPLIVHVPVGPESPGSIDRYTRMRAWQAVQEALPSVTRLHALPLPALGAPARDTLLQAIVSRNHGCTHLLAPDTSDEAREALGTYGAALGLDVLQGGKGEADEALVRGLREGRALPPDGVPPEAAAALRASYPPRHKQGVTVFFTGLSGSGKSTIAQALAAMLRERGGRRLTVLDGDVVRTHLSSELGFSREHRDLNIRRIGFVAGEVTRHGGMAICAPIAPYAATRRSVRAMVEAHGAFVEVYVATPLEVCEQRDRKGLYAKARAGLIQEFTGITDPYEAPERAEVVLDTTGNSAEDCARKVVVFLEREAYLV